jgi:phenylacetic acid degradation protein
MPKVYAIDGIVPVVDPSAFVHPSAVLIGDVIVGPRAYIGPAACLRGDFGRIVVEAGANVQDTCMLHGFPVRRGALVGMNCVVNDNAEVGEEAMVAALAFVKAEARIPPRALAAGIPARVLRSLTAQELQWKQDNMLLYQQLAERSRGTMQEVEALTQPEPGRKRIDIPGSIPLSELKKRQLG